MLSAEIQAALDRFNRARTAVSEKQTAASRVGYDAPTNEDGWAQRKQASADIQGPWQERAAAAKALDKLLQADPAAKAEIEAAEPLTINALAQVLSISE